MSTPGIFRCANTRCIRAPARAIERRRWAKVGTRRIYKRRRWATRTATAARIPSAVPSSRRRQARRRRAGATAKVGGEGAADVRCAARDRASTAQQRSARDTGGTTTVARGLFGERRKFEDEGKLRKVSERLFSDDPASTAVRRSSRIQAAQMQHVGARRMTTARISVEFPKTARRRTTPGTTTFIATKGLGAGNLRSRRARRKGRFWRSKRRPLAEGLRHLAMYRCEDALRSFEQLTRAQYDTAYVLCAVAKAHAEMVDYPNAARYFEEARRIRTDWKDSTCTPPCYGT